MHSQTITETRLPHTGRPITLAMPEGGPPPGAPIVVSLHYGGPVPPHYGRGLLEHVVAPGLAALGAIVVAPDCPAPAWSEPACVDDVLAAIGYVVEHHGADRQRVVLAGYSKGGIGAWELSDRYPERFAAIVVMAGRVPPAARSEASPVPAYVIHGEHDELFALDEVRATLTGRAQAGQTVTLQVLA